MSDAFTQTGRPLSDLIDALEGVDEAATPVLYALAEAGSRLVYSGFTSSRAPDGTAWAPLVRPRVGLGGPLVRSGDLRDYASAATIRGDSAIFVAPSPKGVHQVGSTKKNLPARPFYPVDRLPVVWETVLDAAAEEALARRLP